MIFVCYWSESPVLGLKRPDLKFKRHNLGLRPGLGSVRPDYGLDRLDLGFERPDLGLLCLIQGSTSRPRAIYGQRYPMPCYAWL